MGKAGLIAAEEGIKAGEGARRMEIDQVRHRNCSGCLAGGAGLVTAGARLPVRNVKLLLKLGPEGLTLLELLVAVTLFSVVLLVTMSAFGRALRMTRDSEERTLAAELARRFSEVIQAQELGRDNAAGNRFRQVRGFNRRPVPVEGSSDPPLPPPFQGVFLGQPQQGEPVYRFEAEVVACPVWTGGDPPWDYAQCDDLRSLSLKQVEIRIFRPGEANPLIRLATILDDQ
jgi:prepilin-type N-terminal cleavage/methylation domain-containing protein